MSQWAKISCVHHTIKYRKYDHGVNGTMDRDYMEARFLSLDDVTEREAVADQIDGCQQKMRYVLDQITETQTAITDMDATKVCPVFCPPISYVELLSSFPSTLRSRKG
ncbi:unnamed protein product [Heligmosomoides polygyrus]|uniref:Dynamin_M domain-containing protein n=1 Tax=Heligmosomoides polygyrus TaxID=6339 RepID=A0A183FGZ3_HELPZ|nr:unnamed protein product [Heligmosomoides polygyrus]